MAEDTFPLSSTTTARQVRGQKRFLSFWMTLGGPPTHLQRLHEVKNYVARTVRKRKYWEGT